MTPPLKTFEAPENDVIVLPNNPPVRDSGDLKGSENIKLEYKDKIIEVKECCIIADRHIHISEEDALKYNLKNKQIVKLKVFGEKGGILDNVKIKVLKDAYFECHLDLDDANAHLINNKDVGEIINE